MEQGLTVVVIWVLMMVFLGYLGYRKHKTEKSDPVFYCETYRTTGCSHVDGYLCDMRTCTFNTIDKVMSYESREKNIANRKE